MKSNSRKTLLIIVWSIFGLSLLYGIIELIFFHTFFVIVGAALFILASLNLVNGESRILTILWDLIFLVAFVWLSITGTKDMIEKFKTRDMDPYQQIDYLLSKPIQRNQSSDQGPDAWKSNYLTYPLRFGIGTYDEDRLQDDLSELYRHCGNYANKILVVGQKHAFPDHTETHSVLINLTQYLPESFYPKSLDEVGYILLLTSDFEKISEYSGGTAALKENTIISLLRLPECEVIYQSTVYGDSPPYEIQYESGHMPYWRSGGEPIIGEFLCEAILAIGNLYDNVQ